MVIVYVSKACDLSRPGDRAVDLQNSYNQSSDVQSLVCCQHKQQEYRGVEYRSWPKTLKCPSKAVTNNKETC